MLELHQAKLSSNMRYIHAGSVCFASRGKSCLAVILPLVEHD